MMELSRGERSMGEKVGIRAGKLIEERSIWLFVCSEGISGWWRNIRLCQNAPD